MSEALYDTGSLRFWSERELAFRETCIQALSSTLQCSLTAVNKAWEFRRVEGPVISPRSVISPAYDESDIWTLTASVSGHPAALRAETTATSYAAARHALKRGAKVPLCVWQVGKSFRRETNDGASPAKLRFFEFWQCEFQSIYARTTKADYRAPAIADLKRTVGWLLGVETRIVESDRLPDYSESTLDIEAWCPAKDRWFEVASVSIRTDFAPDMKVLEVAFGLDRLVELRGWEEKRRVTEETA